LSDEIDDDRPGLALQVLDAHFLPVAVAELLQKRQRVVKRMRSPLVSASSAPKIAACRKRFATPRASKG
jgi:hypothetical protein